MRIIILLVLVKTNREIDATFKYFANQDCVVTFRVLNTSEYTGQIVFSFRKEISLKTKVLISTAFPYALPIIPMDAKVDDESELYITYAGYACKYFNLLLCGFFYQNVSFKCKDGNEDNPLYLIGIEDKQTSTEALDSMLIM